MAIIPEQGNPFLQQQPMTAPQMPNAGAPAMPGAPHPNPLAALLRNPQVLQQLLANHAAMQAQGGGNQAPAPTPMPQMMTPPPAPNINPGFRVPLPAPVNPAAPAMPMGIFGGRQPSY